MSWSTMSNRERAAGIAILIGILVFVGYVRSYYGASPPVVTLPTPGVIDPAATPVGRRQVADARTYGGTVVLIKDKLSFEQATNNDQKVIIHQTNADALSVRVGEDSEVVIATSGEDFGMPNGTFIPSDFGLVGMVESVQIDNAALTIYAYDDAPRINAEKVGSDLVIRFPFFLTEEEKKAKAMEMALALDAVEAEAEAPPEETPDPPPTAPATP